MPHYSTLDVDQFLIRLDLLETTAGRCLFRRACLRFKCR